MRDRKEIKTQIEQDMMLEYQNFLDEYGNNFFYENIDPLEQEAKIEFLWDTVVEMRTEFERFRQLRRIK